MFIHSFRDVFPAVLDRLFGRFKGIFSDLGNTWLHSSFQIYELVRSIFHNFQGSKPNGQFCDTKICFAFVRRPDSLLWSVPVLLIPLRDNKGYLLSLCVFSAAELADHRQSNPTGITEAEFMVIFQIIS